MQAPLVTLFEQQCAGESRDRPFIGEDADDFGIDAYFDVVRDLDVTGQSVAAQIKCGVTYFAESTEGGYTYRGRSLIPGTSVTMTFIEFKNIDGRMLTGRTQDPGTTILQLRVRDVAVLTAKLKAAGVPIVTTGGAPVEIRPGLEIALVPDPSNLLIDLIQAAE